MNNSRRAAENLINYNFGRLCELVINHADHTAVNTSASYLYGVSTAFETVGIISIDEMIFIQNALEEAVKGGELQ